MSAPSRLTSCLGDWKAPSELQHARQLGDNAILTDFLAFIETSLDHLPEAHEIVDRAMKHNPDYLGSRQAMYRMAFLEGRP